MFKRLPKRALSKSSKKATGGSRGLPGCAEPLEPRVLLAGHVVRTISGRVFDDLNGNGTRQPKEHWLPAVIVYLDLNGNGVLDTGDLQTPTNKTGTFTFHKLPKGTYSVVVVPPAGDVATIPINGTENVNVSKHSVSGLRFGVKTAPVTQPNNPPPDTTPPGGQLTASSITSGGYSPYRFSVTWTDSAAVDVSSFGDSNVIVTGPGSYSQYGTLVALDATTNGSPRTTTYQIPAPTGGWSVQSNGTYFITLEAGQIRDTLGNADPTLTLGSFYVALPAKGLGSPVLMNGVNGATADNNSSSSSELSFTVANTVAGAQLTLQADGAPIGTATANAGSTAITTNGQMTLADGTHVFSVVQSISNGAQATSATTDVVVDTAGPTASLTAPTITTGGIATYAFAVTYSDDTAVAVGSITGANLQVAEPNGNTVTPTLVSLDADVNGPMRVATYSVTAPDGSWSAADDGTYTVTLLANQVSDEVGNFATSRVLGTFAASIGLPLSPATASPHLLPASDTGAFSNDGITYQNNSSSGNELQFSVGGTKSGATVTIFADGTPIGSATATGSTTTVVTNGAVTLLDGTQLITAEQMDSGFGPSPASSPLGIVVDTKPPTASSSPGSVSGAGAKSYSFLVVYRDNIAVDVTHLKTGNVVVTGPNGFSQTAVFESVNSTADGSPRTATYAITPPGGSWQPAGNGTYTILLNSGQIFDTAGNVATAATLGTFTVNAGILASPIPGAPQLSAASDTGVSNSDGLTNLNNASTSTELGFIVPNTVAGATVTVYADGTAIGAVVASGTTTAITTNGTTPLSDGPHTITARQQIPGDGQSTDSTGATITIETSAPVAGALAAPDVTSGGGNSYSFTVTYTDAVAVKVASLGSSDVTVTGPSSATLPVTFVSASPNSNSGSIVATYQIMPPDGAWSYADSGTYTISTVGGQVQDTAGNFNAAGSLGSFNVSVAQVTTISVAAPALAPVSDTGTSDSDDLTDLTNSSPSTVLEFIVGNTVAGATVTIYADGTAIGSAMASGTPTTVTTSGNYTLTDGTHAITAIQQVSGEKPSAPSGVLPITVETSIPTAAANLTDITTTGGSNYTFTVTYSDDIAIDPTTLGNANIVVTGPNGYSSAATLVSVDNSSPGSPRTATYQIVPSDSAWSATDDGQYTVTLQANQVFNTAGTAVTAVVLGTFNVGI